MSLCTHDCERGPLVGSHYILGLSFTWTLPLTFFTSPGVLHTFLMFLLFRKQMSVLSNTLLALGYCGKAVQGRACNVCPLATHLPNS